MRGILIRWHQLPSKHIQSGEKSNDYVGSDKESNKRKILETFIRIDEKQTDKMMFIQCLQKKKRLNESEGQRNINGTN